jgi:hydrogenase expression/formation protein HypC
MCLAIPAKVLNVKGEIAEVEQMGKVRKVNIKLVKPRVGDYVLVQGNFVVEKIDEKDAIKSIEAWKEVLDV